MAAPRQNLRILHVDDDKMVLCFVKQFVSGQDPSLQFTTTVSPSAALELLKTRSFDCILLDYRMPEMNGIQLAQRIRAVSKTPIILYTGQGSEEVAEQAYAAGIDDYIRKEEPQAHYRVLARRIRHVIEKHRVDELYRTVVESCPDACSISRGNTFLYANQATATLLGFKTPSEIIGKKYLQWLVEEDRQIIVDRNARLEGGLSTSEFVHYRLRTPAGIIKYIESHGTSVAFEGAPATLAFTRDITETKLMEHRLKASEERYRLSFEAITDAIHVIDTDYIITIANEALHRLNDASGITGNVVGQKITEALPFITETQLFEYKRVFETGDTIVTEEKQTFNGVDLYAEIKKTPILEGGKVTRVLTVIRDVTAQKKLEAELKRGEEKHRVVSDNARDLIFRFSFTRGFEYLNKASLSLLGYTPEELYADPEAGSKIIVPEDMAKLLAFSERIAAGRLGDERPRLRWCHKDGHIVTLELTIQPIVGADGRVDTFEGVARDVSQSIAYEHKLEALHSHSTAIALADDIAGISKATLNIIESVLGFHLAAFMVPREGGLVSIENRRSPPLGRPLPLDGKGITVKAAREKRTIRVGDIRLDPDYVKGTSDSQSELAVPVILDGETIALINLESIDLDAFTEDDQSFVEILSEHISSAVKKLRLLESERDSRDKLEALHYHSVRLSSLNNFTDIARFTLDTVHTVLGHDYGGFAVINGEKLEFLHTNGIDLSRVHPIPLKKRGITTRAIRTGQTQYVPDVSLDSDYFPDGEGLTRSELDVPIKIDGKPMALLNLESKRLNAYTDEDRRIVEVLCEHVALALRRLNLLEKEKRDTERLEALQHHAVHMSAFNTVNDLAQFTLEVIKSTLGYGDGAFALVEDEKIRFIKTIGTAPRAIPDMPIDGRGVTARAVRTKTTQLISDTRLDADYVSDGDGLTRSELDIPILIDGDAVALINLETSNPDAYSNEDKRIAEILGEHVALTIKKIHLLENERDNSEKLEALNRSVAALSQSQSTDEALDITCKILSEDFGYQWVGLGRVDDAAIRYVKYLGATSNGNDVIPLNSRSVTVRAVQSGETQVVRDTSKDPDYLILTPIEMPYLSELTVPVRVKGRVEYVINIEGLELDAFTDDDRRHVELLAIHLGSAIELIRERDRLAALHKHAPLIALAKDIPEIAKLILNTASDVFQFPIAGFHVVKGNAIELVYVPGFTENGTFLQPIDGPGLIPLAMREKRSLLVDDVRLNEHYVRGPIGDDIRLSELVVPVILGDKCVAAINLENSRPAAFTEEDRRMVELLALHVGTAMELIEEKKQLQDQQMAETRELLEGANRISSMVRHDLRGPLQSIKNATFLAEQQPEKSREMLEAIDKSVDYATKMLDDLRNSTSPIRLVKTVVNVNDLVEQSLAAASIPSDINVRREYSEGFIAATLDSTRIRRALDNLIKNAVEAMPKGGDLTVTVRKEGEVVKMDIIDTGVGIPKEVIESLFRPFFTTKPRGTGLGLAVCRQAVEAHGGNITLVSEPGKGTTFTMRLPLKG